MQDRDQQQIPMEGLAAGCWDSGKALELAVGKKIGPWSLSRTWGPSKKLEAAGDSPTACPEGVNLEDAFSSRRSDTSEPHPAWLSWKSQHSSECLSRKARSKKPGSEQASLGRSHRESF